MSITLWLRCLFTSRNDETCVGYWAEGILDGSALQRYILKGKPGVEMEFKLQQYSQGFSVPLSEDEMLWFRRIKKYPAKQLKAEIEKGG